MIPEIQELASWIFRNAEIYDFSIKLCCEETGTEDLVLKMEKISQQLWEISLKKKKQEQYN